MQREGEREEEKVAEEAETGELEAAGMGMVEDLRAAEMEVME